MGEKEPPKPFIPDEDDDDVVEVVPEPNGGAGAAAGSSKGVVDLSGDPESDGEKVEGGDEDDTEGGEAKEGGSEAPSATLSDKVEMFTESIVYDAQLMCKHTPPGVQPALAIGALKRLSARCVR